MGIRDRHDRPASHAQEILRRIDHLVAALEAEAQTLLNDSPIIAVHLVMFVNAAGVETQMHFGEPDLKYPATMGIRVVGPTS